MFATTIIVALSACLAFGLDVNLALRQTGTTWVALHPNGVVGQCLDVQGNLRKNGTPVQIYDCNGSSAQRWEITPGRTKVQLWNTNLCLDAGSKPANNVHAKVWTCYDNLPAQDWYYTNDARIAVTNKGQCLDFVDGLYENGNPVQTYKCTDRNPNQVWTVARAGKPRPKPT